MDSCHLDELSTKLFSFFLFALHRLWQTNEKKIKFPTYTKKKEQKDNEHCKFSPVPFFWVVRREEPANLAVASSLRANDAPLHRQWQWLSLLSTTTTTIRLVEVHQRATTARRRHRVASSNLGERDSSRHELSENKKQKQSALFSTLMTQRTCKRRCSCTQFVKQCRRFGILSFKFFIARLMTHKVVNE